MLGKVVQFNYIQFNLSCFGYFCDRALSICITQIYILKSSMYLSPIDHNYGFNEFQMTFESQ